MCQEKKTEYLEQENSRLKDENRRLTIALAAIQAELARALTPEAGEHV